MQNKKGLKKTYIIYAAAALLALCLGAALYPAAAHKTAGTVNSAAVERADSGVYISELMASNTGCLPDCDGDFGDWIELYNGGDTEEELTGWFISDSADEPQKWELPELTLAPGEFLLIFCDGKDVKASELHANFSLSKDGESVSLYTADGALADELSYDFTLDADCSLIKAESGETELSESPTPGLPNTEEGRESFLASQTVSGLAINEIMTANDKYIPHSSGAYYDWAELKNFSDETISLSGWSLTDDKDDKRKYMLPDASLEPGELYLVMFSSDTSASSAYAMASFGLNAEEEWLYLYDESGELADYIHLCNIPYECSMGRQEDGWYYFSEPSPNAENTGGCRGVSGQPEASAEAGIYNDIQALTVELKGSGDIYYTLDGSLPTEDSLKYEEPLTLEETTSLRAICVEENCIRSDPVSLNYIINENHTLPVVALTADPEELFGDAGIYRNIYSEEEIYGNISYYEADGAGEAFSINCGLKLGGNGSRETNSKKSLNVKFRARYGTAALNYDLFEECDVDSFKSLSLRAGQDYRTSVIREEIMTSLASEACPQVETKHCRYCVLYINGEYYGLYSLKEFFSEKNYAEHHGVSEDSVTMVQERSVSSSDAGLYQLMKYAENNDLTQQENFDYLAENINIESLTDWMILEAYCANTDLYNIRYFMSTEDGGKWSYAFYDLDLAFLQHSNLKTSLFYLGDIYSAIPRNILENEEYRDYFLNRLAELLTTTLSDEHVLARIDELEAEIMPEMERDRARWNSSLEDWDEALDDVRSFISEPGRAKELAECFAKYLNLSDEEYEKYFWLLGE